MDDTGLLEPLPRSLASQLRRAVLDHARSERRRVFPALVHVGVPGADQLLLPVHGADHLDHSLRTDVLAAMLAASARWTQDPLVWLTRPGELLLQDLDAQWLAAGLAATAEAGRPLTLVVVNRHGWRDPRSGLARSWVRIRSSARRVPSS